jgi:RNA polymerase sigma-70 factor (ECF subfamily)
VNYASVPAAWSLDAAPGLEAPAAAPAARPALPPARRGARSDSSARAADALLLAIARDRSEEAFAELFDRYAGRLKHFFVRGGIEAGRSEELVQDVLLAVWRRASTFDASRSPALTWLYALARNRRIDEFRARGHMAPRAEDLAWDATLAPSTEGSVETIRRRAALREALVALPAEQRAVLHSTFFDGKSLAEIASDRGLPLGTVKSRARLALARLRRALHQGETA